MSYLDRHLEQIALASESISTLPFPPPRIFTNALLTQHDITALIRDTEPHERALFSVPPPQPAPTAQQPYPPPASASTTRRRTVFSVAAGEVTATTTAGGGGGPSGPTSRAPRKNAAVAAVLGPELHSELRRSELAQAKGELDIEVLLRGAAKLNEVFATPGVPERIQSLRARHAQLQTNLRHYETKVARQTRDLERINRADRTESWNSDEEDRDEEDEDPDRETTLQDEDLSIEVTEEDLRREEEEIQELERKKKQLEERVTGMEKDLGGLLR